jgi:hypothetical protein
MRREPSNVQQVAVLMPESRLDIQCLITNRRDRAHQIADSQEFNR